MTYSIFQVNINSYDKPFPANTTGNAILFTDENKNVNGWNEKIISSDKNPFNTVFDIRWHPFKYTNDDYVIWTDGSIEVKKDPKKWIDLMKNTNSDFAIIKHPYRTNIYDEYVEWVKIRNYDKLKAFSWLSYMTENGWNPKQDGLYQSTIMIFKNCDKVKEFCNSLWEILHTFDKENVERLDQTVASYLIKTKFQDMKVLELPKEIMNCDEFSLHWNHPMK